MFWRCSDQTKSWNLLANALMMFSFCCSSVWSSPLASSSPYLRCVRIQLQLLRSLLEISNQRGLETHRLISTRMQLQDERSPALSLTQLLHLPYLSSIFSPSRRLTCSLVFFFCSFFSFFSCFHLRGGQTQCVTKNSASIRPAVQNPNCT